MKHARLMGIATALALFVVLGVRAAEEGKKEEGKKEEPKKGEWTGVVGIDKDSKGPNFKVKEDSSGTVYLLKASDSADQATKDKLSDPKKGAILGACVVKGALKDDAGKHWILVDSVEHKGAKHEGGGKKTG